MNRTIEIEFAEEAPVEIYAVTASAREADNHGEEIRPRFWLAWQLFAGD